MQRYSDADRLAGAIRRAGAYEAARRFDEARRLLPDHAGPCNNLGLVYEEAWRRKVSLASGQAGAVADGRAELDRAIEFYRQAIRLDPDANAYRTNLSRALVNRGGRTDEVRSLLKQVIEQDSRPQWQSWARRKLSAMGGRPR